MERRWITRKRIVLLAGLLTFALLLLDVTGRYYTAGLDDVLYSWIHALECPFSTGVFLIMSNMVHPVVLLIISMTMIHVLRQRKYLVSLFVNLALGVLLNLAAKGWIMRERPPFERRLVLESGYSFPSGHSMVAATFYGFIIFLFWQTRKSRKVKMIGTASCVVIILLVGISRIYLGVHFPTDVLGGFLAGLVYLIIYTSIVKKYFAGGLNIKGQARREVHPLIKSFQYAFAGIITGLKTERNMMIHYSALGLVVVFGITLKLSVTEWCICLILCALVISMEMINTAVEAVVDLVTHEQKRRAKIAKDTAAGAVLVSAVFAVIIGGLIYIPKILALFSV